MNRDDGCVDKFPSAFHQRTNECDEATTFNAKTLYVQCIHMHVVCAIKGRRLYSIWLCNVQCALRRIAEKK